MSTPPPARCHIGAEWNDGQGAGLHLSGLNGTASPASYPQHGFVVQSVRMPRFWGDAGSNPVEARWARRPHAKRRVPEREIVCDRWHEPVAGQEFLCSHGPSAVPHAGTVPPLPRGRGFSVFRTHRRKHGKEIVGIRPVSADRPILPADRGRNCARPRLRPPANGRPGASPHSCSSSCP